MDFKDISSELWREYDFGDGHVVHIDAPDRLNVSPKNSHRIVDSGGLSHYVPPGWFHLKWQVKDGREPFDF